MIGIYKITNRINNKIYIGQSINCEKRFNEHKSSEHNKHLKRAYDKYGLENFSFEVLEETEESLLNERETYYIEFFNSINPKIGYNKRAGGDKPYYSDEMKAKLKEKRWGSDEQHRKARDRMSDPILDAARRKAIKDAWANKSEEEKALHIEKSTAPHIGSHLSEETRKKMSESHKEEWKSRKNRKRSEASNLKTSESLRKAWATKKEKEKENSN